MPVCTNCTYPATHLYTAYKTSSNIRLSVCVGPVLTFIRPVLSLHSQGSPSLRVSPTLKSVHSFAPTSSSLCYGMALTTSSASMQHLPRSANRAPNSNPHPRPNPPQTESIPPPLIQQRFNPSQRGYDSNRVLQREKIKCTLAR